MALNLKAKIKQATRVESKVRLLVGGPSGSGKTLGALLIAKALVGGKDNKVLVVDSEHGRASHKADCKELGDWKFDTIPLEATEFNAVNAKDCIDIAEKGGYEAIILDSTTAVWDNVNEEALALGGRYTDRKKPMEKYHKFVRRIISSKIHIIGTVRQDEKTESQVGSKGKMEVVKLGLTNQSQKNFKYEWDFVFNVRPDHTTLIDKQEGDIFQEDVPFLITEETGCSILEWLSGGEDPSLKKKKGYISRINELVDNQPEGGTYTTGYSYEELLDLSVEALMALGKKVAQDIKNLS